jgi:uridine phosphorylase
MPFPNLKKKHEQDSMFSPEDFKKYRQKLGKYPKIKPPKRGIICYDKDLLKHIIECHEAKKVDYFEAYIVDKSVLVAGGFGFGAPVACTILEELNTFGVKEYISIGTAGTLQKNQRIGDIVVCESAIRDEGTSHHYLASSKYSHASDSMTKKIVKALKHYNIPHTVGTSWTIDAPYRETVAEAKQYQKEGVLTVEMEAAALFAVAQYRRLQIGAIFTISDSLAELEWKPQFHSKKTHKGLETLWKVATEALSSKQ